MDSKKQFKGLSFKWQSTIVIMGVLLFLSFMAWLSTISIGDMDAYCIDKGYNSSRWDANKNEYFCYKITNEVLYRRGVDCINNQCFFTSVETPFRKVVIGGSD